MVMFTKCPCGCDLEPTLRLEVLVNRLLKAFPAMEKIAGINCGGTRPSTTTVQFRLVGVPMVWQQDHIIKWLNKEWKHPFLLVQQEDCFTINTGVKGRSIEYAPTRSVGKE